MFSKYPTDEGGLDYYTCVTLIDITKTDVVRHYIKELGDDKAGYEIKRNQQRNYQTMLQVIGLRCQAVYLTDPVLFPDQDLAELGFGTNFTKEHVWAFSFGVEQKDVFMTSSSPYGLLLEDIHNVPVILNLTETAKIKTPMLDAFGHNTKNIIILK